MTCHFILSINTAMQIEKRRLSHAFHCLKAKFNSSLTKSPKKNFDFTYLHYYKAALEKKRLSLDASQIEVLAMLEDELFQIVYIEDIIASLGHLQSLTTQDATHVLRAHPNARYDNVITQIDVLSGSGQKIIFYTELLNYIEHEISMFGNTCELKALKNKLSEKINDVATSDTIFLKDILGNFYKQSHNRSDVEAFKALQNGLESKKRAIFMAVLATFCFIGSGVCLFLSVGGIAPLLLVLAAAGCSLSTTGYLVHSFRCIHHASRKKVVQNQAFKSRISAGIFASGASILNFSIQTLMLSLRAAQVGLSTVATMIPFIGGTLNLMSSLVLAGAARKTARCSVEEADRKILMAEQLLENPELIAAIQALSNLEQGKYLDSDQDFRQPFAQILRFFGENLQELFGEDTLTEGDLAKELLNYFNCPFKQPFNAEHLQGFIKQQKQQKVGEVHMRDACYAIAMGKGLVGVLGFVTGVAIATGVFVLGGAIPLSLSLLSVFVASFAILLQRKFAGQGLSHKIFHAEQAIMHLSEQDKQLIDKFVDNLTIKKDFMPSGSSSEVTNSIDLLISYKAVCKQESPWESLEMVPELQDTPQRVYTTKPKPVIRL